MANMQLREKLRELVDIVAKGTPIPESSKRIGMRIWSIFCLLAIVAIFFLATSLLFYQHWFAGGLTIFIACLLTFFWYKIWTAEDIPID